MQISSTSFEPHPIGSFYGKIVRIEEDISKFDAKPQLVLTVETEPIYGEKKERSLPYWTSTSLSPQSKLGSVYMAVSGEEVSAGLTIDTKTCLISRPWLMSNIMNDRMAKPEAGLALGNH